MIVNAQEARYMGGYRLWLRFNTGESGEVELDGLLHRYPAARPLLDVKRFADFYLDAWPSLAWKCGFDISPETLYERVTGKQPFSQNDCITDH